MATSSLANKDLKTHLLSWNAAQCRHNTTFSTCLVLHLTHLIHKVTFVTLNLSLQLKKRRCCAHEATCGLYVPCWENDRKFCHQWTPQRRIFHFPTVSDNNMAKARIWRWGVGERDKCLPYFIFKMSRVYKAISLFWSRVMCLPSNIALLITCHVFTKQYCSSDHVSCVYQAISLFWSRVTCLQSNIALLITCHVFTKQYCSSDHVSCVYQTISLFWSRVTCLQSNIALLITCHVFTKQYRSYDHVSRVYKAISLFWSRVTC